MVQFIHTTTKNRKNRGRKTFYQDQDNNSEGHLALVIRHSSLRLDCQSSNSLDTNKYENEIDYSSLLKLCFN
jgi:hypothetical protein